MVKITKTIIIFGVTLLLTIVGVIIQPQSTMSETQSQVAIQEIVQANNAFGLDLFTQLWTKNKDQNIFISPTSVAMALSMLYNGTAGETATEIAEVLHTSGLSLETINSQNRQLREILQDVDTQVQLAIANSLWLKNEFNFQEEFLQNNQTYYNAQVSRLDFSSPESVSIINNWVKDHTAGKIPEIIDAIDPQQILFLINAVYFKGEWTYQFLPENTIDRPFQLSNGQEINIPTMSQTTDFPYWETEDFQAISLPYGKTENLSMEIFLPNENSNLEQFFQQLSLEKLQQWLSQLQSTEVAVLLPKFKVEYEKELKDILINLGMQKAFSAQNADFSAMTPEQVEVSGVKHKTFVEVTEEGTEAAAVTSIGVRATSIGPMMVVNRPFFYTIRDRQTGTILFMGAMLNPKGS